MRTAVLAKGILYVCLYVLPSHSGVLSVQMNEDTITIGWISASGSRMPSDLILRRGKVYPDIRRGSPITPSEGQK